MQWTSCDADPHERSRDQSPIRVREKATHLQRSGGGIKLVVDKIDTPLMRKPCFVFQLKGNRHPTDSRILQFPLADLLLILKYGELIHIEIGVDRIHADDIGQLRGIRLNEVTDRDKLAADEPFDR